MLTKQHICTQNTWNILYLHTHTVTDLWWVEGITELLLKYTGAACTWKTCNQIVVFNSYIHLKAVYFKMSILNRCSGSCNLSAGNL